MLLKHLAASLRLLGIFSWGTLSSHAALLNLASQPLFLGTSAPPNVFFTIDDSGSMDWEVLLPQYWLGCAYNSKATGNIGNNDCGSFYSSDGQFNGYTGTGSTYANFAYIYPNSDNLYSNSCSSGTGTIQSCTAAYTQDWRVLSSSLNRMFYNPSSTYNPWNGPCYLNGSVCTNATFTSARSNPREGSNGYSLVRDLSAPVGSFQPATYEIWIDDKGWTGTRPRRGTNLNVNAIPNQVVDLWDSHIQITLGGSSATITRTSYAPTAAGGLNPTSTLLATLNSTTACYDALGTQSLVQQIFNGTLAATHTGSSGCRTLAQAQQNFANWYQYSRRRSLVAKNAVTSVLNQFPNFRYGLTVINNYNQLFVEMPAASVTNFTAQNNTILNQFYAYPWAALGTPSRQALQRTGMYFAHDATLGKGNPIIYGCQQNFNLFITDGYWNGASQTLTPADTDGDGIANTLADVMYYYYKNDLSSLSNNVVPNAWDPATWQHLVQFGIAYGVPGLLKDTDGDGWPNPSLAKNGNWGNPFNSDPEKLDDMWHGTFNSGGRFINAQTPEEIISGISNALGHISERVSSSASVAEQANIVSSGVMIYQALFDTNAWKGELLSFPFNSDGSLSSLPNWDAGCLLTGGTCTLPAGTFSGLSPSNRLIFTKRLGGGAIPFTWPANYNAPTSTELSSSQINALLNNAPFPAGTTVPSQIVANQTYGNNLVNFLRGDRSQEILSSGTFRNRTSVLGDIIHAAPIYVGPPNSTYPDAMSPIAPYSTFKSSYAGREALVYVGANDGMVHGFDALTGIEKIGYVPSNHQIYQNLPLLTQPTYNHQYFVDGGLSQTDALINGSWKSVLVGSLGAGGQGVYGLDITDPSRFTQNNLQNLLLFEFNDTDDPDLGYTLGTPQITQVRNGSGTQWAAIFGNGYNNSFADGNASGTGKAALFILFINQGLDGNWTPTSDYIKIPVGTSNVTTPNGLATPALVDTNEDYVTDYVYAGDLQGNLWRFDLTSSTPSTWINSANLLFTAQMSTPGDQPITTQPKVIPHPNGISAGVIVTFGTGKYLEPNDASATGQITQSLYGIWDKMSGSAVLRTQLLQQTIVSQVTQSFDTNGDGIPDTSYTARLLSSNAINWNTQRGWYLDLIASGNNAGERVVANPLIRGGKLIFTTLVPNSDMCSYGGTSWLIEISPFNGGALTTSPFDVNNDGLFNSNDYFHFPNGVLGPASALQSTIGIIASPTVLLNNNKTSETKVLSGTSGISTVRESTGLQSLGRQNWRQL